VKETRIDIGVRKPEIFQMKDDASINEMHKKFTNISNELHSLETNYTTHERMRNI